MAKISLDGFQMNVDVHRGLAPLDTLFIHGNLASNRWWEPALEEWKRLAKPSFEGRLIFAEWRGCGQSAAPHCASDLDPETLAADYVKLLREMKISKVCLVGHSTGGLIALLCVLRAPELFDRVVLLDSVSARGVQFEAAALEAFTQMSRDRAVCAAVMGATIHGCDPTNAHFQLLVDDAFSVAKEIWHGIPKALHGVDISKELRKVHQPVLVLHGEHDPVLPLKGSRELAELLPNGRFHELKGQGHSANVENPKAFVQITNEFLFNRP